MGPAQVVHRQIWREGGSSVGSRSIPEETAVALTYNGGTYAVMMATPQDLQDFAVGFSLSEGVIDSLADIDSLDIVRLDDGIELRIWLSKPRADRLQDRRRHIAGPTGCGLCGIESIAEALRPAAIIGCDREFSAEHIMAAMRHCRHCKKSTSRHEQFMQPLFGMLRGALSPCVRTLAAIMRSTSLRAHWRRSPLRQARESFSSPAGFQWRWCRRALRLAHP